MKSKKTKYSPMSNYIKYSYFKTLLIKSIIVVSLILILLLAKKLNLEFSNGILSKISEVTSYQFKLSDGKLYLDKTMTALDNSLQTIKVFNMDNKKIVTPITGTIYKKFGQEVIINSNKVKNNGMDIKSNDDNNPIAFVEGTVSKIEDRGSKGYYVSILSGNTRITYGYIINPLVSEGQLVSFGDEIGELGTNKDGSKYLRLEIEVDGEYVDPIDYIGI